jgi:hypothetical protein
VSRNKLCVSTNFIILGAKDQKLWVFEIFGRSLDERAYVGANEKELTTCAQKGGLEFEKRGGNCTKQGAQGQLATSGCPSVANRSLTNCGLPLFLQFLQFF